MLRFTAEPTHLQQVEDDFSITYVFVFVPICTSQQNLVYLDMYG